MFENAYRLGSIAGIRIGVHYTWFIIVFLLITILYQSFRIEYPAWSAMTAILSASITTLMFFVSIVLHELGHSLVAMRYGIQVRSITLFIFGGVAQTEQEAESAAVEFWVAIAGPAVSLVLAAVFYVLSLITTNLSEVMTVSLQWLSRINLIVAIFNMIPGFPLDGGRVFRAVVWTVSGNAATGMQWAVASGKLLAYLLMGFGVFLLLQPGLMINGVWMLAIGWFLFFSAQASGQSFMINRIFRSHYAREYMESGLPSAAGHLSISAWLEDHVFPLGRRAFIVQSADQGIGLVTLSDCNKVPRAQWDHVPLREIMTPIEGLHAVQPDAPVSEVLLLMATHSINQVPVVEYGKIIGWIDRDRLIKIIQIHDETGL